VVLVEVQCPEISSTDWGRGVTKYLAVGNPDYLPDFQLPASDTWLAHDDARWHPYFGTGADAFDPDDPPTFESQATSLRRMKLFLSGEEKRLTKTHFEPEPASLKKSRS
jgi:hypothetical protein